MFYNFTRIFAFSHRIVKHRSIKIMSKHNGPKPQKQQQSNDPLAHLNTNVKFEVLPSPIKSASDKKEYKVIRLENGLTVCLISDVFGLTNELCFLSDDEDDNDEESDSDDDSGEISDEDGGLSGSDEGSIEIEHEMEGELAGDDDPEEQKMCAAALCVSVGSFSDPKDIPGMAHFLEHMVFMGSEKFPKENDFDSYISKRGGSDNASTDCELTAFYFECLEKHLYKSLDKFAQFFIAPLMKRGSMTREREAIHSEFQMALPSDSNRKEQLLSSLANINSPVNTFTWGNLTTLKDNVTDDDLYSRVHEFRKRHYSANRMTLAIKARLPMNYLQSYVLDCFAPVPNNKLPGDDFKAFTNNVFDTPEFHRLYYVEPTTNITQVDLTWALPSLLHKYKSKPHQYVSWLLGNEGVGSLIAYLRKKVWVLGMSTGNGESGSEHNSIYLIFQINITLTDDGLAHLDEVIELIFSYINMLIELGPQERIYNEIKLIEDTSFRFAEEQSATDLVEELAESMHFYTPEDYIAGSQLYYEYDPDSIRLVLNSLTTDKVNVIVLSNKLPDGLTYDKTEKWFGTKYTDRDIPSDWLKRWQQPRVLVEFKIPEPNQFLTNNFDLLPIINDHPDYPQSLIKNELVELWFRKDQKFQLPLAYYYLYLINPVCLESSKSFVMLDMYVNLLLIQLGEEAYPAQIAELNFKLVSSDRGIVIKVYGYNEKLPMLIELISKYIRLFNTNLSNDIFEAVRAKLKQTYHNGILKPNSIAKDMRVSILVDTYYTLIDKYNAISTINCDDMKQFATKFCGNLYVKALIQGNLSETDAKLVINNFITTVNCQPLAPDTYPKFRVARLPIGERCCRVSSFNKKDSNSIITNYYQSTAFSIKNCVIIEMISLLIEEPVFNILRTKEQLGYHVHCAIRDTFGILGFSITVNAQATKFTTEYVDERIEQFVKKMSDKFEKMKEKSFNETRKDLIKMKQRVEVTLEGEVDHNWIEIIDDDYMFDRKKVEIKAIEELQVSDVRKWWNEHNLCGDGDKLRKLSIQVVGFNTDKNDCDCDSNESITSTSLLDKIDVNYLVDDELLKKRSINENNYFISDAIDFKKSLTFYPVVNKTVH